MASSNPPTAVSLRTPQVLVPSIIALCLTIVLFILAFRQWCRQDHGKTLPEIEAAIRQRRHASNVVAAIDVEACRGTLNRATRSTGTPIRLLSPIREKTGQQLDIRDIDGVHVRTGSLNKESQRLTSPNGPGDEERGVDGGELERVTTWGSILATASWVKHLLSRETKEEETGGDTLS